MCVACHLEEHTGTKNLEGQQRSEFKQVQNEGPRTLPKYLQDLLPKVR